MGKPEIRFKGYTDEWEQRKLGEVTQCLDSERVPINSEEREKIPGEIPYYGAGNIQGYINKFLFDEELVLLLEDGDAFDDFRTKEIAQYICGKTWVNNHAHVLRPLGDAYFLYITLSHKDIRNWVQLAGASRKKLVQKSMLNIELFMPHIIEQKKIGQYFSNLDHLITLHQRKCDEIKSLKKYMLQKMFPQNEQKVPEIRFEGFTEAWEQRKLGDVAQEFKSGNSLKADEIDITGDYPVYGGNGLRGYTSTYNHDGEYALIGRQGALCGNMNYSAGKAYFTEHAVVVKADENNVTRFLYYMLDTMNLGQYSDQSAQPGLAVNKLVKLENSFPKKEEQQQIGAYFRSLDHLITLHQRKPIPHPNHPTIHTKHKGEEKYVRIRVNDRGKINRTANLRRFPVDIPGGFKDGGRSVGEFQIYSGAE